VEPKRTTSDRVLMDAVRAASDTLEGLVADDLWPLPTYQEMLYIL
jgi:glutamine synthetase